MKNVFVAFVIAALAGIASIAVAPQQSQAAATCAPAAVSVSGQGANRNAAKTAAISVWQEKVKQAHGPELANWTKAADKRVGCAKTCPKVTCPGGKVACQVSAKPCS